MLRRRAIFVLFVALVRSRERSSPRSTAAATADAGDESHRRRDARAVARGARPARDQRASAPRAGSAAADRLDRRSRAPPRAFPRDGDLRVLLPRVPQRLLVLAADQALLRSPAPARGRSARTSRCSAARLRPRGEIVDAWMGSPGHRANLLRELFREAGVAIMFNPAAGGVFGGESTWVITLDLGSR